MAAANPPFPAPTLALPRQAPAERTLFGLDYKWTVFICTVFGTFMIFLDSTIVNIALPKITAVFGITVSDAQLVITGYLLAAAVVMPAAAYLGDTLGTKRLFFGTLDRMRRVVGVMRFNDFRHWLGIAPNVLANRPNRPSREGVVERRPYREHPLRYGYHVTDKGRNFWPIVVAFQAWSDRYQAPDRPPVLLIHRGCGGQVQQHPDCSRCGAHFGPRAISRRPGPGVGNRFGVP